MSRWPRGAIWICVAAAVMLTGAMICWAGEGSAPAIKLTPREQAIYRVAVIDTTMQGLQQQLAGLDRERAGLVERLAQDDAGTTGTATAP